MYGIWHAYKYTLTLLYRTHFSLLTYLHRGTLAEGTLVPTGIRIRSLEMLVAALLRLPEPERRALRHRLVRLRWRVAVVGSRRVRAKARFVGAAAALVDVQLREVRLRIAQLESLQRLLSNWLPAAFAVGKKVRDCNWAGEASGSGKDAKQVLLACLLMMLPLTAGESHLTEYVRTLVCALVVWREWHTSIPGACFTDELNEASLHQLGSMWAAHPEITAIDQVMDLFLLLPPPPSEVVDLEAESCTLRLAHEVKVRVRILAGRRDPALPYVQWLAKGEKSPVRASWPVDAWFPPSVRVPPEPSYLSDLFAYTIATLIRQRPHTPDVLHTLHRLHFPTRSPTDAYHLSTAADRLTTIPERFDPAAQRRAKAIATRLAAAQAPNGEDPMVL